MFTHRNLGISNSLGQWSIGYQECPAINWHTMRGRPRYP